MEEGVLYVLVNVYECMTGTHVHIFLSIHACLCIYPHTCVCVFMGEDRNKGVNSEFIFETVPVCVCMNTDEKGCVCLLCFSDRVRAFACYCTCAFWMWGGHICMHECVCIGEGLCVYVCV